MDIVKHDEGSDPASVVFDTINRGIKDNADVIICDTAGRIHNKKGLMDELGKIYRVIDRELPYSDREIFLVLDATTGQNAISQAKEFMKVADVTGIVLTKLDGTARGGVVLSIKNELKLPVKFIGVGEGLDDLQPFSATAFAESLFDPIDTDSQTEIEEKLDENLHMEGAKDVEVASLVQDEKDGEDKEAEVQLTKKEQKQAAKAAKEATKREAEEKERIEAEKAKRKEEKRQRDEERERKRAEKEARERARAEEKAKAEAEKKRKAEEKARKDAEDRARRKAEAERKAREEAEKERLRKEAEAAEREKAQALQDELEAERKRAEAEQQARREAREKAAAEARARYAEEEKRREEEKKAEAAEKAAAAENASDADSDDPAEIARRELLKKLNATKASILQRSLDSEENKK